MFRGAITGGEPTRKAKVNDVVPSGTLCPRELFDLPSEVVGAARMRGMWYIGQQRYWFHHDVRPLQVAVGGVSW